MEKQEFDGELQDIDPWRLVGKSSEEVENFFLVLSVIFNDLKSLINLSITFHDSYESPKNADPSVHLGNYSGVELYLYRMMSGLIHEFFRCLRENSHIYELVGYKEVIKNMPAPARARWCELIDVALDRHGAKDASEFAKLMKIVRNSISFHYYESGGALRKGFESAFFSETPKREHQAAYYSVGKSMRETRFLYADAAVQEYVRVQEGKSVTTGSNMAFGSFIDQTVGVMNHVLKYILESYIDSRPHGG